MLLPFRPVIGRTGHNNLYGPFIVVFVIPVRTKLDNGIVKLNPVREIKRPGLDPSEGKTYAFSRQECGMPIL